MKHKTLFEDVLKYLSRIEQVKQLVEDVKFLIQAIKENPLKYGAIGIAALMYFLSPIDAVPDALAVVGFVDDAAVIAAAVATIKRMMGE